MSNLSAIKGMHCIKTLNTSKKNAIPGKETDYLNLYMLEKEKKRLLEERGRLTMRLQTIDKRLKEIENSFEEAREDKNPESTGEKDTEEKETGFKTMTMEY